MSKNENLGRKATDKVTGFSGVVTGFAQYLTGCNQYLLSPPVKADGTRIDGHWFDEFRLEFGETVITAEQVTGPDNGGPQSEEAPVK